MRFRSQLSNSKNVEKLQALLAFRDSQHLTFRQLGGQSAR